MVLYALAWIVGSLVTISTVSIIMHARLSSVGKAIIGGIIAVTILAFVLPEKNPHRASASQRRRATD